jgi:hypothetical protein
MFSGFLQRKSQIGISLFDGGLNHLQLNFFSLAVFKLSFLQLNIDHDELVQFSQQCHWLTLSGTHPTL